MIPDWYWNFWCPDEMRTYDPQGCGIGLGLGAMTLLLLTVGMLVGIIAAVIYFWPAPDKEMERARFTETTRPRRKDYR